MLARWTHSQIVIVVDAVVEQPGDASGFAARSNGTKPKDVAQRPPQYRPNRLDQAAWCDVPSRRGSFAAPLGAPRATVPQSTRCGLCCPGSPPGPAGAGGAQ
eukprot:scaffold50155_cov66-Phaeocystis_antarctica.AAC.2